MVVVGLLDLMLLLLDILLGHHLRLKFANLRILILGDYLVLFLLLLMVLIVYCLAFFEKLFRPYLLNLMPLVDSLHLLFLSLLLLVLAVLYLPSLRVALLFVVVLKNHIHLLLLLRFWLMVSIHPMYCISVPVSMCFLLHH